MRTGLLFPLLFAVAACGDAVARPGVPASEDVVAAPRLARAAPAPVKAAEIVPPAPTATPTIGALERPAALRRFFQALARLDEGRAHDDVRVLQFGDSHTAADLETGAIRRALQARFGDGGRGFVAIGKPWKHYLQDGVRSGMSNEWSPEHGKLVSGKFVGDGCYGLGGVCLLASRRGARAWTDVAARTSRMELAYLEQPGGGSIDLLIDGARVARVATKGPTAVSAFKSFDVTEAPHQVEVRAAGDGDVRVFGVTLDRTQAGVTLDALGINGARVTTALQWNEQHMAEQLKHRAPDLVVLAYGTNESGDDTPAETYERQLVDVLGRVARAVPTASCLLLGPPDRALETRDGWVTSPKLLDVIASQRRVAAAAGCAYYNQFEAMGGDGTIAAWALEEPQARAAKDRVHLSREGYVELGSSFVSDTLRAYVAWRTEMGLPEVKPPVAPPPPPLPQADPERIAQAQ